MLSVNGDESADETKKRVFAVAGVVGTEDDWGRLEAQWAARNGGIPFHANDCESDRGDYKNRDHRENKALYRDLSIMLANSGLGGWGVSLDLIAQRRVFPEAPVALAYYKGLLEVVEKMKNCAAYNHETVEFTFDMRPESEHNAGMLYGIAKQTKSWSQYLSSKISFACSREYPRVQVADLFAYEAMKALDNRIGPKPRPPRKSWLTLHATGRFHVDVLSDDWFNDLRNQMPELEKAINMSMEDYVNWLVRTKKMVDNISNRFEYIRFVIQRDGE